MIYSAITFVHVQLTTADYIFEIMAHNYRNQNHLDKNGDECDVCLITSSCSEDCDNQFTFCLRDFGDSRTSDIDVCPLGPAISTMIFTNSDLIIFGIKLGPLLSNPVRYTGSTWPVGEIQFLYIQSYIIFLTGSFSTLHCCN